MRVCGIKTSLRYLVVRHLEHIAEASAADVICHFISHLEGILERRPSHCCYIRAVGNDEGALMVATDPLEKCTGNSDGNYIRSESVTAQVTLSCRSRYHGEAFLNISS